MSSPNWGNLYKQGRCKAIGIPWNAEESHAVYELGIPAAYVRRGALSVEAYEDMKASDDKEKPIEALNRDELKAEAKKHDVEITDAASDDDIRKVLPTKKASKKATKKSTKKKAA